MAQRDSISPRKQARRLMLRLLLLVFTLLALAAPARADDISAAGRSVVRVVVVTFEEGEVVGFGHGSGFAVAPNRIVTNAHVVAAVTVPGVTVGVGVVPSEGSQAYRARIVAVDASRDLALVEVEGGRFTPIPLFTGALEDGQAVAALGYPGNVDLATARSADDYITPLPPTRSVGIFSNARPINGVATLLHTANIARGHSGGPLLDQCGRVLGVNTLITRNESGDAPFAFAVGNRELVTFLTAARQPYRQIASECVALSDRLRSDEARAAAEARAREAEAARREREADAAREAERLALQQARENRMALAALLLVLAPIAFSGAAVLMATNRKRGAIAAAGTGGVFLIAAIVTFASRPSLAESEAPKQAEAPAPRVASGAQLCRLVPERSRVTVTSAPEVPLEWSESGCMNGRTQYAQDGETWRRVLVPEGEEAVSLLEFRPAQSEYVVSRYALGTEAMTRIRALRRDGETRSCAADSEARTRFANQQRDIAALLPRMPNERLVYACEARAAPAN